MTAGIHPWKCGQTISRRVKDFSPSCYSFTCPAPKNLDLIMNGRRNEFTATCSHRGHRGPGRYRRVKHFGPCDGHTIKRIEDFPTKRIDAAISHSRAESTGVWALGHTEFLTLPYDQKSPNYTVLRSRCNHQGRKFCMHACIHPHDSHN